MPSRAFFVLFLGFLSLAACATAGTGADSGTALEVRVNADG